MSALTDLKFTDADFEGQNVKALPDTINNQAAWLKARFDNVAENLVAKGKLNDMIDLLASTAGAENIGAAVTGITGDDVQAVLSALKAYTDAHAERADNPHGVTKAQVGLGSVDNTSDLNKPVSTAQGEALALKVDKEAGKGLSQNDYTNEDKAQVAQVKDKADRAEVLTKGNTTPYTPTGDYHPVTKKYADNLAFQSGAVMSVFGRAGAVSAQSGDYDAAMITETETRKFVSPAEKGIWNGKADAADLAGKADVNHNHDSVYAAKSTETVAAAALPKTGGAMTGQLTAGGAQDTATAQVRNIYAGTSDMTAGTTALETGTIYFMYE